MASGWKPDWPLKSITKIVLLKKGNFLLTEIMELLTSQRDIGKQLTKQGSMGCPLGCRAGSCSMGLLEPAKEAAPAALPY